MKAVGLLIGSFLLSGLLMAQSISTEELLEKADFLIQNSRFDDGLLMLSEAQKKDPDNAVIYFKQADALINLNKFKDAVATLEVAVEKDPQYYPAYEMLGNLYFKAKNANKAVENYDSAFSHDESIEGKMLYKLQILDILDKLDRRRFSKRHIEDAKAILGENFDLLFYEVMYYNDMEDYQKAFDLMTELIKDVDPTPGNERYYYEYAVAANGVGNYEAMRAQLKHADGGEYRVKLRLFTPQYYFNLANSYFKIYEYEESEKFLTKVLAMDPSFGEAYELQKKLAAVRSPKEKIIKALVASLNTEKDPRRQQDKRNELAHLYFQNEQYFDALQVIEEYLRVNQRDIPMVFLQAVVEDKLDQHDLATEALYKITRNPKLPSDTKNAFGFALGRIYMNMEQYERAEMVLRNAFGGNFKDAIQYEVDKLHRIKDLNELGI